MMRSASKIARLPSPLRPAVWLAVALLAAGLSDAPAAAQPRPHYRDGDYDGTPSETGWGEVQLKAIIRGGALVDVQYLRFPDHRRRSMEISNEALPAMRAEAIQTQSARVHILSGATATGEAFRESLASALSQASGAPAI